MALLNLSDEDWMEDVVARGLVPVEGPRHQSMRVLEDGQVEFDDPMLAAFDAKVTREIAARKAAEAAGSAA